MRFSKMITDLFRPEHFMYESHTGQPLRGKDTSSQTMRKVETLTSTMKRHCVRCEVLTVVRMTATFFRVVTACSSGLLRFRVPYHLHLQGSKGMLRKNQLRREWGKVGWCVNCGPRSNVIF
jgi:hypothetical protein